jgi:2-phosphosulfolactate phosphatase
VAALVNASAAVEWLAETAGDALLVCSGQLGRFSAEDAACAGFLVARLAGRGFAPGNDAAGAAMAVAADAEGRWHAFLQNTDHGQYLSSLGFGMDLSACGAVDSTPVVPEWDAARLVRFGKNG